jgi:2-keto-4-pentenoate hydratase
MSVVDEVTRSLQTAYATGHPIAPVRDRVSDVATAYAIQQAQVAAWLTQGRRIVGRKIGLTAKVVQKQLGVDEPDFGTILDHMVAPDRGQIAAGTILQPRVEAEIAFVLAKDLDPIRVSPDTVVAVTDYVCPAIEICGSRISGWDIKIADTIADNASAGMIVLGMRRTKAVLAELPGISVSVRQNGAVVAEGAGQACLGNPAIAVAWLAEALGRLGTQLRAGDIVMSGALARMIPGAAGDDFAADFGAFGSASIGFAR